MSRLDSFIRRMSAQRDILNDLAPRIAGLSGLILEFGLGSGRSFDHLCEHCPGRRIVVFESVVNEGPTWRPPPADTIVGDIRETSLRFADGCAALIHADIESGIEAVDAELASWLPAVVARLLAPGGYAASGAPLADPRLVPQPLPAGVREGRYHVVRRL
jgi:hypothetical protein